MLDNIIVSCWTRDRTSCWTSPQIQISLLSLAFNIMLYKILNGSFCRQVALLGVRVNGWISFAFLILCYTQMYIFKRGLLCRSIWFIHICIREAVSLSRIERSIIGNAYSHTVTFWVWSTHQQRQLIIWKVSWSRHTLACFILADFTATELR